MRLPKYRLHKSSGQALVEWQGKRYYLGVHGSPESRKKYWAFIRNVVQASQPVDDSVPSNFAAGKATIDDFLLKYLAFAERYYVDDDGRPNTEFGQLKYAANILSRIEGETLVSDFGPKSLKRVRSGMIAEGWKRKHINHQINRVRRMIRWGVGEELVPGRILEPLLAIGPLRRGKTDAQETEPIRPVPDRHLVATLRHCTPVLEAMIRVHRRTGMRAGELVIMRPIDIDRSSIIWIYIPERHKVRDRDPNQEQVKRIPIGPKAQRALLPYLDRAPEAFCFSPKESEAQRNEARRAKRKTRMTPSQVARSNRRQKRLLRDRYDVDSYRQAIQYAAAKAGVPEWFPLQVRHARGTEVRKRYKLEGAQVSLGHASADVTQIYAERDFELALKIAAETG